MLARTSPGSSSAAYGSAVAQTLNRTGINPALLAERDLEPSKLAQYLLEADPSLRRQFSPSELALYQRIISESSELIVDIASQLLAFTERTLFFIRLRQCAQDGLPAPEDFPRLVAPAIAGTMPARWVHDKLRSGQAIVLIDGVDEVAQSLREQVRQ